MNRGLLAAYCQHLKHLQSDGESKHNRSSTSFYAQLIRKSPQNSKLHFRDLLQLKSQVCWFKPGTAVLNHEG